MSLVAPPGRSRSYAKNMRAEAAREGHASNFSRSDRDAPVRMRLRELAAIHHRFGYRRLHVLSRREGVVVNHKKLRRLYREERLQVRRHIGRKRALGTRAPMAIPQGSNQRWSLDSYRTPSPTVVASFWSSTTTSPANA